MTTAPKVQRRIDLLAALLSRRQPMTFAEIAQHVPAYMADGSVNAGEPSATLKRMFERDKLELRAEGIPLESVGEDGSAESAYVLRTRDFYLPYLAVMSSRGLEKPDKVDRYGYRALQTLTFEADELEAIVDGARLTAAIGHPTLTDHLRGAMRKLAFDLPLGAVENDPAMNVLPPHNRADPRALHTLGDALFRRKRVAFIYQSIGTDTSLERDAEPYGVFFLNGHWYLVAHDVQKDALRNFRVSRLSQLTVHTSAPLSPDYDIPASFSLAQHARSKRAWEIGDHDAFEAVVAFRGTSGATRAAAALGRPHGETSHRVFDVRRMDSFARWLLSFAGEALPVSPTTLVQEFTKLARDTHSLYAH